MGSFTNWLAKKKNYLVWLSLQKRLGSMFFPLSFSKKCKKLWVEFWKFWKTKNFFLRWKFLAFFQSEDERNFIVFIFSAIYYTCDSLTYFTAFMQFQSKVQWKASDEVGPQIRLPARITGNWIWVNQTCLFIESLLLYIYAGT